MAYTNRAGIPLAQSTAGNFNPRRTVALSGAGADAGMPWLDAIADQIKNTVTGGGGGPKVDQAALDAARKKAEEEAAQYIPGVPNMYLYAAGAAAAGLIYMNSKK